MYNGKKNLLKEDKEYTKIGIITFEIVWKKVDDKIRNLSLSEVHTLTNYMRRSYTSFWKDKHGKISAECPEHVELIFDENITQCFPVNQSREAIYDHIYRNRYEDTPIFDHWRAISGLKLANINGYSEWHDPSDEHIPLMNFIALNKASEESASQTMSYISDDDWMRLAYAEKADEGAPYNTSFCEPFKKIAFYDRFFPDHNLPDHIATRHIFGGSNYNLVTVADPSNKDDFPTNVLQLHFRRHYAQLDMIVRFEHASLLRFSERITEAVVNLKSDLLNQQSFEKIMTEIHQDFLLFVNKFRFSGVSNQTEAAEVFSIQLQAAEMFRCWRRSLGSEALFEDVRSELQATADFVRAEKDRQSSRDSNKLAKIATFLAACSLVVGFASIVDVIFVWFGQPDDLKNSIWPGLIPTGGVLLILLVSIWTLMWILSQLRSKD